MPGDTEGLPWRIRRVHGSGVEKVDEHDVGDSDSEVDAAIVEDKHETLLHMQEEAYSSATAGLVNKLLEECAAKAEEVEKVGKPKAAKKRQCPLIDVESLGGRTDGQYQHRHGLLSPL